MVVASRYKDQTATVKFTLAVVALDQSGPSACRSTQLAAGWPFTADCTDRKSDLAALLCGAAGQGGLTLKC